MAVDVSGADPASNALVKERSDMRWQMNNKNERLAKDGLPPRHTDLDTDVNKGVDQLAIHRARGYPAGFKDKAHFQSVGSRLKADVAGAAPPAGGRSILAGDIVVQGSAVHQPIAKDVDIAVLVTPDEFNQLLEQSFPTRVAKIRARGLDPFKFTKTLAIGSAEETYAHAVENGKITRDKLRPRLSDVRENSEAAVGVGVDLSVVKRGGKFDHGSYFPL